ncbi:MAG: 50S ribosomal protein L6 [Oscillospiraceae bacterium]|jgi:large subunit ribosomal protein L6|nr:50S ribosomal protein L6 [Oscillospiraceae bacterium]
MSRIGKKFIPVPAGVNVTIDGSMVTVKGPKGTLSKEIKSEITVRQEGDIIYVERGNDEKISRSLHGLSRTLVANMVEGVTNGFIKELEISGVGYRCAKEGSKLNLTVGYSHPTFFEDTDDIKLEAPTPNKIIVSGIDKQKVGQFASEVRGIRPIEPYKGKGIKYAGEHVIRKEGKAGKGKK